MFNDLTKYNKFYKNIKNYIENYDEKCIIKYSIFNKKLN